MAALPFPAHANYWTFSIDFVTEIIILSCQFKFTVDIREKRSAARSLNRIPNWSSRKAWLLITILANNSSFLPSYLGMDKKGEKKNQSLCQQSCLSARSSLIWMNRQQDDMGLVMILPTNQIQEFELINHN